VLGALQGLLGQTVTVLIELRLAQRPRPIALMRGVLRTGTPIDLADHEGAALGYPPGEAILFDVSGSTFIARKDDFKFGARHADALSFEAGRVRFLVYADSRSGSTMNNPA
jgi:hypothetical protein